MDHVLNLLKNEELFDENDLLDEQEVDRIKNLFTEERLYGNLIIEAPISSIKNIFTFFTFLLCLFGNWFLCINFLWSTKWILVGNWWTSNMPNHYVFWACGRFIKANNG